MSYRGVLLALNELIDKRIIKDYAVIGGFAAIYYMEPTYTVDVDVAILLDEMDDYHRVYQYFREQGSKIEDVYIYIDGTAVQLFPAYAQDLYEDAVRQANEINVDDVPGKVVSIEHLIALYLKAYRSKDKIRISELLPKANRDVLERILKDYDNGTDELQLRYRKILKEIQ